MSLRAARDPLIGFAGRKKPTPFEIFGLLPRLHVASVLADGAPLTYEVRST